MEFNDIYDENRRLTGRLHRRGDRWKKGEYGLVVCVWVYDGKGHVLLTRRAPEKSFAGTWENSGGAALAGETSRQAICRELQEETGICASPEEFELLGSGRDHSAFYDYYCIRRDIPIEDVVLQPGETDDCKWVAIEDVFGIIERKEMCAAIAKQFQRQVAMLRLRQK